MMLDRAIIDHASPTLARLKLGSLINLETGEGFFGEFARLSDELRGKGVKLTVLRLRDGKALLYVYRPDELERALRDQEIRRFLTACGYFHFDAAGAVQTLRTHLKDMEPFPHEIGVFLGYPLADVLGFIENCGKNCLACGCWKVYSDLCFALQTFRRFEKCKTVYQRLFAQGYPLSRLTVAARPA